MKTLPWFMSNLQWIVGNGAYTEIGLAAIIGLPSRFITTLHNRGFIYLKGCLSAGDKR